MLCFDTIGLMGYCQVILHEAFVFIHVSTSVHNIEEKWELFFPGK